MQAPLFEGILLSTFHRVSLFRTSVVHTLTIFLIISVIFLLIQKKRGQRPFY